MEFSWVLFLSVILANAVEATAGFGGTLIAVSLASALFPIQELIALLVPANLLLSILIVSKDYQKIDWNFLGYKLSPGIAVGFGLTLLLPLQDSEQSIRTLLAVFLISFSLWKLKRISNLKPHRQPTRLLFLLPVLGGFLQGLFASGGPPVVAFYSRYNPSKIVFRATLSCLWLILNTLLLISMSIKGMYSHSTLQNSAWLLPGALIGLSIGQFFIHKISQSKFERAVLGLLFLNGVWILTASWL